MRLLAFVLIFTLSALPAQARDKILDIQEVISPGGIKAWLVEDHSVPVIAVQFAFRGAGAALDPADKQGIAQLASNTMDEGAGDIDSQAFQKELEDLSITLRFSSGRDDYGGQMKTLTRNKERAFELLRLALTAPRFDEEPVGRMRAANQSRIKSAMADPEWIAARLQNDLAFAGHPYAQNSGGTLSSLDRITPEDLHNFVKTRLGKNILYIGVAGDITAAELGGVLDKVFGTLPDVILNAPEDIELQNQGGVFVYEKDIPQTVIEIMQPGIARTDPDYHKAQVMNFILGGSGFGSRLTEEIREKRGLTYGIYSGFYLADHANGFTVSTSTVNEKAPEVLALIKAEWQRMLQDPVSAQELADAKTWLTGSLPLSLTSTDAIAGMLLSIQADGFPIDYLEKREEAIEAASVDDVSAAAKKILAPEKFVTVMVGKPEGIEAKKIESVPNVE